MKLLISLSFRNVVIILHGGVEINVCCGICHRFGTALWSIAIGLSEFSSQGTIVIITIVTLYVYNHNYARIT